MSIHFRDVSLQKQDAVAFLKTGNLTIFFEANGSQSLVLKSTVSFHSIVLLNTLRQHCNVSSILLGGATWEQTAF